MRWEWRRRTSIRVLGGIRVSGGKGRRIRCLDLRVG